MEDQNKEQETSEKKEQQDEEKEKELRQEGEKKGREEEEERGEIDRIIGEVEQEEKEARRGKEREEDRAWRKKKDEESREAREQTDQRWKMEQGLIPLVTCAECNGAIYLVDLDKSERRKIYKSLRLDGKVCCLGCRGKILEGLVPVGECFGCKKLVFHKELVYSTEEHPYCAYDCLQTSVCETLITLKQQRDKTTAFIKEKETELTNFNEPVRLVKEVLKGFSIEHLSSDGRNNAIEGVREQLVKKGGGLPYAFYSSIVEKVAFIAYDEHCLGPFERKDCTNVVVKLMEPEAALRGTLMALNEELLTNKVAQDGAEKMKEWVENQI